MMAGYCGGPCSTPCCLLSSLLARFEIAPFVRLRLVRNIIGHTDCNMTIPQRSDLDVICRQTQQPRLQLPNKKKDDTSLYKSFREQEGKMQRRNKLSFDSPRNVSLRCLSISFINQTDSNGGTLCEWIVISYDCVSQKPNSNPTGGTEISADLTGPMLGPSYTATD